MLTMAMWSSLVTSGPFWGAAAQATTRKAPRMEMSKRMIVVFGVGMGRIEKVAGDLSEIA